MYFCENDKIMGENHLTYFKIENFKRFDSFEMENLGQFNLLVGDNNVGKTSVLEALTFDEEDRIMFLRNYIYILFSRNILQFPSKIEGENLLSQLDIWSFILKNVFQPLIISYKTITHYTIKYEFVKEVGFTQLDKDFINNNIKLNKLPIWWIRLTKNGIYDGIYGRYAEEIINALYDTKTPKVNFLPLNMNYHNGHTQDYYSLINGNNSTRILFDSTLKSIIPNLIETRPHKVFEQEVIGFVLNNSNEIVPITTFGDGVLKIVRILLGLMGAKGNRLMIDEIDTGIHFSRLQDFWKTVITLCKQFDVQLFATTHSLECQRYFVEALSELGEEYQKDARNISLLENAKGEVKSVTFDFEQFEFALSIGANTRGGQR